MLGWQKGPTLRPTRRNGLQMRLEARAIGKAELARATQLVNKTNQFNLTTRRFTDTELERLAHAPGALALAIKASEHDGSKLQRLAVHQLESPRKENDWIPIHYRTFA